MAVHTAATLPTALLASAASTAPPARPNAAARSRSPLDGPRRCFFSLVPSPALASAAAAAASPARVAVADEHAPSPSLPVAAANGANAPDAESVGGVVVSFPLAQTGEGIAECELVRWHVRPGDRVEEFQPLCEVQSDKASVEITSRHAGTVETLHHAEGALVPVGAPLADIRLPPGAAPPPGAAVVAGGGDGARGGAGGAAERAASGGPVAAPSPSPLPSPSSASPSSPPSPPAEVLAPPAVRALARQLGVDLAALAPGTGVGGRLTKEDVQAAADARGVAVAAAASVAVAPPTTPPAAPAPGLAASSSSPAPAAAAAPSPFERVPIRGYARTMLRTSTEALSVPMFYFFDEVRVDALAELRAQLAGDPMLAGRDSPAPRLTLLPFIIKALSVALLQHPSANASLDLTGDQPCLLRHADHNVGVAMAAPGGLVVPNIKRVQEKGVAEIAAELAALRRAAVEGRVPAAALAGGTITVSNIGALGGTHATPLVHPPQAAIVAIGRARALPRFAAAAPTGGGGGGGNGGNGGRGGPDPLSLRVESHLLMDVSWGADHRVVDGAEVARLSNCWRGLLEEPSRLLLHMR